MLSDTTLQLFYRKIPKVLGIQPAIAANVGLPTSKLSRARTMVFAPGASAQLSRAFENVLGGEVMILTSAIYSHPIYQARNPEVVEPRPAGAFQCVGGGGCQDLLSGVMNPSDTVAHFALLEGEMGQVEPGDLLPRRQPMGLHAEGGHGERRASWRRRSADHVGAAGSYERPTDALLQRLARLQLQHLVHRGDRLLAIAHRTRRKR